MKITTLDGIGDDQFFLHLVMSLADGIRDLQHVTENIGDGSLLGIPNDEVMRIHARLSNAAQPLVDAANQLLASVPAMDFHD